MSTVLAVMFPSDEVAEGVRTLLVEDGFPTDHVELTSRKGAQQAELVFPTKEDTEATQILSRDVIQGGVVIAVHPREDIEILEIAEPVELR